MIKEERRRWPPGWSRLLRQEEAGRVLGDRGPLHGRVLRLSGTQARFALMMAAQGMALGAAVAIAEARPEAGGNALAILGAADRARERLNTPV